MTRARTKAACDASAAKQFAPWGDYTPPEHLYADMRKHITPRIKALADAEWEAMDAEGRLPADFPERRAEIERRFAASEGRAAA